MEILGQEKFSTHHSRHIANPVRITNFPHGLAVVVRKNFPIRGFATLAKPWMSKLRFKRIPCIYSLHCADHLISILCQEAFLIGFWKLTSSTSRGNFPVLIRNLWPLIMAIKKSMTINNGYNLSNIWLKCIVFIFAMTKNLWPLIMAEKNLRPLIMVKKICNYHKYLFLFISFTILLNRFSISY